MHKPIIEKLITLTKEENERMQRLAQKKERETFEVAFCGHFSAGKSSILNHLIGADVLPTSPIPTSANIIEIKNGEQGISVFSKDGQRKQWQGEIPWTNVREWGMNGQEISKLTLFAQLDFLGEHSTILDTPGVDSTDETHQTITVEQQYTTDVIVYVMDYNYVQSETNLFFLKQLTLEKKPIFIVINQIDKHNEEEIPFSIYKHSVEEVFRSWEIQFIGLYFTSMKNNDHRLNQFALFEKHLKALLYNSQPLMDASFLQLEKGFYLSLVHRLNEEKQEVINELIDEMKQKGYDWSQLEEKQQLSLQLEKINHYSKELSTQFDSEITTLFKSVTLFPAITTDLARDWIESLQPGFKVGLLFTKKKTIEEQERRLEKLINDLQMRVKSQLLFHIQTFFQKIDRVQLSNKELFEEEYNKIAFDVTKELVKSHVNKGHFNREYVYAFTGEVTEVIVKDLRHKAKKVLELQIKGMAAFFDTEKEKIKEKLETFVEIEKYEAKITEMENSYATSIEVVEQKLKDFPSDRSYNMQIKQALKGSFPTSNQTTFSNVSFGDKSVITTEETTFTANQLPSFSEEETNDWLTKIKTVLCKTEKTDLLAKERKQLVDRIERYQNKTFIISLFGAFSAGKSSFANALLGETVLPVSPNPTTATITTVRHSTDDHPHGNVVITMKTKQELNEEIKAVSEQLGISITIDQIGSWEPNKKTIISNWQKTYAQFLLTMKESLSTIDIELGSQKLIHQTELADYSANESKACLIHDVVIYYDCMITKKGIVLVDTPGVNSIHGRHTNVAFSQMRNSDAIFYLTYYNHAFSKADQYFLQQMAKVNESFQHDKLYFVINASDLAGSKGELNGVTRHVQEQLVKNGFENPRLYHLSSKEGLEAKQQLSDQETTFSVFEHAFHESTILELKQLSVKMIQDGLTSFVDKIKDSIAFMSEEKASQREKQLALKEIVLQESHRIKNESFQYVVRDIHQEFEQLLVYLRERMRFVMSDYFTSAINVTVLTSNNKKQLQEQLDIAIKEWRNLAELFLKQELEATIIRMEEMIKMRSKQWLVDQLALIKPKLAFVNVDEEITISPMIVQLDDLTIRISTKDYLTYMKSKKDFFEEGKGKQLKEMLVEDGVEKAREVINVSCKSYSLQMEETLFSLEVLVKERIIAGLQHELQRFEALSDSKQKQSLEKVCEEVSKYLI